MKFLGVVSNNVTENDAIYIYDYSNGDPEFADAVSDIYSEDRDEWVSIAKQKLEELGYYPKSFYNLYENNFELFLV